MNYRDEVKRTANCDVDGVVERFKQNNVMLVNAAMGLAGEAGEFADMIKKTVFHGKVFDREKALNELSDIRWYFELACDVLGTSIQEVENINTEKLRKRYPTGFTTKDSVERKDELANAEETGKK